MVRDKAMVVIAVSRYRGVYSNLPGTVHCARRMQEWAQQERYDVLYLGDDEDDPEIRQDGITVDLLRRRIRQFLEARFIDRLVVYFAGHGVVGSHVSQYWLLTDAGNDYREAVDVEGLRRGLSMCNIGGANKALPAGQLCLIGDACQVIDSDTIKFVGDAIVTWHGKEGKVQLDRFFSCVVGEAAYHIDATRDKPAHCLFSDALVEALSGNVDEAIEHHHHQYSPVVTNHKLCDYLETEVARRAAMHGGGAPVVEPLIRPPYNDYKRLTRAVLDLEVPPDGDFRGDQPVGPTGPVGPAPGPVDVMKRMRSLLVSKQQALEQIHPHAPQVQVSSPRRRRASERVRVVHADELGWQLRHKSRVKSWRTESGAGEVAWPYFTVYCDVCPNRVAVPTSARVEAVARGTMYEIRVTQSDGAPILVPNAGRWMLVPHYPNVAAAVYAEFPGDVLLYRPDKGKWDTELGEFHQPRQGTASSPARAKGCADLVRDDKYRYPHQAVAAAYLYEYAGDRDNIVRTAQYMARHSMEAGTREPVVPFDLALLCAEKIEWRTLDGVRVAYANLPAVKSGDPTDGESDFRPHYAMTPFERKEDVRLWGMAPVYRPGWDFLRTVRRFDVPQDIASLCALVGGRSAASLDQKGAEEFLRTFGYRIADLGEHGPEAAYHGAPIEVES